MQEWENTIRYHSVNEEMKNRYSEKVYRISLNANLTCPNRDGNLDDKGCIFCSVGGSGDFAECLLLSIKEQLNEGKEKIRKKAKNCNKFIAYFQAYTNTYGPIDYLRKIYLEAVEDEDVVIISIATRPDCLGKDVLNLLDEINKIKPVWVELGLQSSSEETAKLIRRGYKNDVYEKAVNDLHSIGIEVITHIILGLPFEDKEQMMESLKYAIRNKTDGLKLQLLHVLKGTDLLTLYESTGFKMFELEEYADMIVKCLRIIPKDIVIHRLTGDGPKKLLVVPLWSGDKKRVRNTISKLLKEQDVVQGMDA